MRACRPPWSTADRLAQFDFFAATKQNTYVYSPKDDPYLRAKWREAYPSDQLAVIKQLVDRATSDHVEFTYEEARQDSFRFRVTRVRKV